MSEALKPCPFCGQKVRMINVKTGVLICCRECGANILGRDREQVTERWNRRAEDDE